MILAACALAACEKPYLAEDDRNEPPVVVPGEDDKEDGERGDSLLAQNDTAVFYVQRREITGVTLDVYENPAEVLKDSRYRVPTRLEVATLLRHVRLTHGIWKSGQRVLCYDAPTNADAQVGSTRYGMGGWYTYVPNGNVTKAGRKTKYCILPIRSERLEKATEGVGITIRDEWE